MILDFHTHILPGMDDGAKDVATALRMLARESAQGVTHVALTSHFYRFQNSPEEFLRRRGKAFALLREELPADAPKLLLGAEVAFYSGISEEPDIGSLCLEGTDLLLVEMRPYPWTDAMVKELLTLQERGMTVVLAHAERYLPYQLPSVRKTLRDAGVLVQVNAGALNLPFFGQVIMHLLMTGKAHFIGSDAHNLVTRIPCMNLAGKVLEKVMGKRWLKDFFDAQKIYFPE